MSPRAQLPQRLARRLFFIRVPVIEVMRAALRVADPSRWFTLDDLLGPGKARELVKARENCVGFLRDSGLFRQPSYPEIAAALGRSSHSAAFEQHRRWRARHPLARYRVVIAIARQIDPSITVAHLVSQSTRRRIERAGGANRRFLAQRMPSARGGVAAAVATGRGTPGFFQQPAWRLSHEPG